METATATTVSDYDRNFNGCVLSIRESNGYHDSDFFATVWDDEQNCVREIFDGTTRCYAPSKYYRANATDEVVAKARAWWAKEIGPKQAYSTLMGQALFIDVGCTVLAVKGRKVAKGTVGEVFWKGRDAFKPNGYCVGIRLHDGSKVFTSMDNVAKIGAETPTLGQIADWVKSNNPY